MEETRHLASWLGSQEALHDRVLTLDQALAELEAVNAEGIHALAKGLIRDEFLRLTAVTPRSRGRGLEAMLKLPGAAA